MTLEIFSNMDRIQLAVGHNKLGFSDGVIELSDSQLGYLTTMGRLLLSVCVLR